MALPITFSDEGGCHFVPLSIRLNKTKQNLMELLKCSGRLIMKVYLMHRLAEAVFKSIHLSLSENYVRFFTVTQKDQ